jgi:uncharacterized protein (TIGR04222 family)
MNPLDFTGPVFLLFFTIYALAVWRLMALLQDRVESADDTLPRLTDPYEIGYLRLGVQGALQVAVVSLMDRGLVGIKDDRLILESNASTDQGTNRLENRVLVAAETRESAGQLVHNLNIASTCKDSIEPELVTSGLLPSLRQRYLRQFLCLGALVLVLGMAISKLVVATARGRSNIGFLVIEAIVFIVVLVKTTRRRRTRKGNEALKSLTGLFGHLKSRADGLKMTFEGPELIMLAAVFGTPLVPSEAERFVQNIASPQNNAGGCGSGGCGGGGSCGGGGGCGGGCGGCGS